MEIFGFDWISFFIVGLGTMFLLGELLVNTRGLFAIFGLAFITLYFLAYLDPSMFIIMGIIYFFGVLLIFLDGQFINDGALASIGAICMIVSIGLSSPNWVVGLYAVIGLLVGGVTALLWLKFLPKRNMWSKITLLDQLTDEMGYSTMNAAYRNLIGQQGVTITDMRPVGTIRIQGNDYSAVTNGHWIKKDTPILVQKVDGTRILVEELIDIK
ncbi:nodulation protein NfeD [Natronobacillus azotifigens]|uniref:Nodulation protein NfeD n=2 Tax=Natronobacillus azotifigens TaxID=472978 RepID=A0A9J6REH0_9BACI|nr:NfeD family protein [Natronobacillus azotifigens]MCZ0704048.1 nodulation protein NfeD [Natronobacillus azotifigens]